MPESEHPLSRRRFLEVAGLGTAAALGACALSHSVQAIAQNPNIAPSPTPIPTTPFRTGKVILGETAGTTAMPQPFQPGGLPIPPEAFARLPKRILATVHYPTTERSSFPPPTRNPLNPLNIAKGPFPVLLYAHGYRDLSRPEGAHPFTRDFTSVDAMLRYVASWGCVCVAPDLSWLVGVPDERPGEFNRRATVLVSYYTYLADVLNNSLFAKQVDVSRTVLVGHSHGAAGATNAGRVISGFSRPKSLAYGLVAPEGAGGSNSDLHNLLVLGGTLDHDQGANPQAAFIASGIPKTLVMIPGANHFGYTDICPPDNSCGSIGLFDSDGTISRTDQQRAGEGYLAALVRYYALGDGRALPYLNGTRIVEGLESLNLQVQAQGFVTRPTPPVVPTTTHTPVVGP